MVSESDKTNFLCESLRNIGAKVVLVDAPVFFDRVNGNPPITIRSVMYDGDIPSFVKEVAELKNKGMYLYRAIEQNIDGNVRTIVRFEWI